MRKPAYTIVFLIMCCVFFIGCSDQSSSPYYVSNATSSSGLENADLDPNNFYLKSVENIEATEYFIAYRYPNGDTKDIVNLGISPTSFHVVGERIYYATGLELVSVDFSGENKITLHDESKKGIAFTTIDSVKEGWIYCSGTQTIYLNNDPVALDGAHCLPAKIKVKMDFSEYCIVE